MAFVAKVSLESARSWRSGRRSPTCCSPTPERPCGGPRRSCELTRGWVGEYLRPAFDAVHSRPAEAEHWVISAGKSGDGVDSSFASARLRTRRYLKSAYSSTKWDDELGIAQGVVTVATTVATR